MFLKHSVGFCAFTVEQPFHHLTLVFCDVKSVLGSTFADWFLLSLNNDCLRDYIFLSSGLYMHFRVHPGQWLLLLASASHQTWAFPVTIFWDISSGLLAHM